MNFSIPLLQNIPPPQAHFCLAIEKFLCEELEVQKKETTFIVGFSGGVDSTALLALLHVLKPRLSFNLVAAHLDHGIRKASTIEAKHCEKIASYLNIPFYTKQVSIPQLQTKGKAFEETSRRYRYAFFQEVCKEVPNATIALGHHLNDLAEDILMRLTRGAGWPSLSGMPRKDDKRSLCRPLLLTPKQTIIDFISALGIPYVQDASNKDLKYFRNRVRHSLLPFFLEENPSFLQTIANLWQMGRIDEELFDELLEPIPLSSKQLTLQNQTTSLEDFTNKKEDLHLGYQTGVSAKCSSMNSSSPSFSPSTPLEVKTTDSMHANTPAYIKISQEKLISLSRPLRLRLYKKALEQLYSHPLTANILQLDTLWVTKKTGSLLQFPRKVTAKIEKEGILFLQNN